MFNQTSITLKDRTLGMDGTDIKQLGLPTLQRTICEILIEISDDLNDLKTYRSASGL